MNFKTDQEYKQAQELANLLDWVSGDNTGASSKVIFRFMLGLPPTSHGKSAPSDKADRARCITLLDIKPDWWDRLDELRLLSKDWNKQVDLILEEKRNENTKV